jgi:hypothetical protein
VVAVLGGTADKAGRAVLPDPDAYPLFPPMHGLATGVAREWVRAEALERVKELRGQIGFFSVGCNPVATVWRYQGQHCTLSPDALPGLGNGCRKDA